MFFSGVTMASSGSSIRDIDSPATTSSSKLDSNSEEENNGSNGSNGSCNNNNNGSSNNDGSNTPVEECSSQSEENGSNDPPALPPRPPNLGLPSSAPHPPHAFVSSGQQQQQIRNGKSFIKPEVGLHPGITKIQNNSILRRKTNFVVSRFWRNRRSVQEGLLFFAVLACSLELRDGLGYRN